MLSSLNMSHFKKQSIKLKAHRKQYWQTNWITATATSELVVRKGIISICKLGGNHVTRHGLRPTANIVLLIPRLVSQA